MLVPLSSFYSYVLEIKVIRHEMQPKRGNILIELRDINTCPFYYRKYSEDQIG